LPVYHRKVLRAKAQVVTIGFRRVKMLSQFLQVREVLTSLHRDESGQDLIEYALLAALIALAAVVGMNTVASDINNAFSNIGSRISASVT
jgi:pilus assembly protein Flp/PilA